MNVVIAVTHLLGAGHLSRALTLARAFAQQGHRVTVISGGTPVDQFDRGDVRFVQLPPLRSDGVNFTHLLTAEGVSVDDNYLRRRQTDQHDALLKAQPDVLITELFPFGRRVLRSEFLALLESSESLAHKPLVLSSIRDILAPPSKAERAKSADQIIAQYYDGVLVHSDAKSTPLDQSWPVSEALRRKLHYTGYVAPPPAGLHPEKAGDGEIIVSAGGGSVGDALFEIAVKAAHLSPSSTWRLLVGGSDSATRIARLRAEAVGSATIVEPARPDFRQMLYHAAGSVSMCGYNTALDLLQSGVPAVLVPFDDGGEVEQTLRANSLTRLDGIAVIKTDALTPEALLDTLATARVKRRDPGAGLCFDGAKVSVSIAEDLLVNRK
ncbi:MAG: glycosyltransferase [Paracoccaceae bacterium]